MIHQFDGMRKLNWYCLNCNLVIDRQALRNAYKQAIKAIQKHYNLQRLSYDGYWIIKSNEIENDGEKAHRKKLTPDDRLDIKQDVIDIIQELLGVTIPSRDIRDLWLH